MSLLASKYSLGTEELIRLTPLRQTVTIGSVGDLQAETEVDLYNCGNRELRAAI